MAGPLYHGMESEAMTTIGATIQGTVHMTAICSQPGIDLILYCLKKFFISTAVRLFLRSQMGSSKTDTGKLCLL